MDNKEKLHKALSNCYFFLKFRPRSKHEMIDYLNKKAKRFKWEQEVIEGALKSLEEDGFVDDKKFIDWFVNQRSVRKPKSRFLIERELKNFGIDQFLIEDFFYTNLVDEEEGVRNVLARNWASWTRLDKRKRFEKAMAYLQRRGFNYALIKKAIAEMEEKE